ncbi:MAG: DUF805 domain-containing protein [Halomonas sp.]|nr:DUF805 domain-containing protein [Halomonas sp.]TVP46501.1 MAG: DUF805 domain-containing protein [Halomonas sp.]
MNSSSQAPKASRHRAKFPEVSFDILNSRGRLGRVRFLTYSLMILTIWSALGAASNVIWELYYHDWHDALGLGMIFVSVIASVLGIIICTRRLNDFNASGWWMLIFFVPIVMPVMLLLMLFMPGTRGENRFGPRAIENATWVYVSLFLLCTLLLFAISL